MFDDDAGLRDHPAVIHQHGKATKRPERRALACRIGIFEMAISEGDLVFPERDQNLLAIRGEGVRIER